MRLFVAVDLSENVREEVYRLTRSFTPFNGVKTVEKENLHITLKFLGEVKESKLNKITEKLGEIDFEKFELSFRGIGFFPNISRMRVIWVGVKDDSKINILAEEVEKRLAELKFKRENRFKAHATIARIKRLNPSDKTRILNLLEGYEDREFGDMVVEKFVLKKSTLTPKGPIYEDVEVFELK
ncbi:2-5 RNA ligase [Archaeoglobus sulfaticallidus PM70-1]|uniref:RNA 2',3'-cyclic phosphodiesterase n=1 Tax=Archaeoglobus sulfaticallidus PM70-1 TaxID=387631 RepID=N0BE72_9EURY|nr:RNA 2',3'-cyclic phosphodiesterase [Archaeoglobus sulfaticallidus]AGK60507.1 2-5 RNA ligase [Archaeoglobus sulfaticallidus PM70-1]